MGCCMCATSATIPTRTRLRACVHACMGAGHNVRGVDHGSWPLDVRNGLGAVPLKEEAHNC